MKERHRIDGLDRKIIALLREDGRMPNTRIAARLGIAESTVRKRLKKLIGGGHVRVTALVNLEGAVNVDYVGDVALRIAPRRAEHVIEELRGVEEVFYIVRTMGAFDLWVSFIVDRTENLNRLLCERIARIDGVSEMRSVVHLEYIKRYW